MTAIINWFKANGWVCKNGTLNPTRAPKCWCCGQKK